MADPGSFTIPCILGDDTVSHALADLGANINLMPYFVFSRLGLGEPRPTRMSIQQADRSVKYPCRIVENMLVHIGKFIFPVDFVILDMNEDDSIPLILGRPFLATAQALIDVRDGKLILRVGDENVTDICGGSTLDTQILDMEIPEVEMVAMTEQPSDADTESSSLDYGVSTEIVRVDPKDRPSVESPHFSLELKDLPTYLEYAFLDEERKLPVIIVSALTEDEKMKLLKVLRAHKEAITWKIINIKGINPSFCTHKILMEDYFKTVVQPQRRLNPKMQEVVKKEIIKLLDAGIIFPISDSPWAQDAGYPWFADIANFLVDRSFPKRMSHQQKNKFFADVKFYIWDDPYLFRIGADQLVRRCVDAKEGWQILSHCHLGSTVGHHGASLTSKKVFDAGFYWPSVFKDAHTFVRGCDRCQHIAYKTPTGSTPFWMIYRKAFRLPIELEHRASWELQTVNLDFSTAGDHRFHQLYELEEHRDHAYAHSYNCKQRTKELHDRKLRGNKQFKCGDTVLLFNSRLKLFPGKLKSRWYGPQTVKEVFPYGAAEIEDKNGSFKVNGHCLKHYIGEKVKEREGVVLRLTAFDA
ncbi:uncharacterized protein LOC143557992 [Bidens hawaiensis]|uniref:uncharacterized protein LOC143557992 n=1 Tax=Bidens hawaiensis TaxID=980011 RepID=UPI004049E649